MEKLLIGFCILTVAVFGAPSASNAQAKTDVTWVSGSGSDTDNICNSPTAPCASLANAYTHTGAGGTINCLGGGINFSINTLTITQSVTIDCRAVTFATDASEIYFFTVNAGPNDDVTIRGLQFDSGSVDGTGIGGVSFTGGHSLHIENCTFGHFSSAAVLIAPSTASNIFLSDSKFSTNGSGVLIEPGSGGSVKATFDRVSITQNSGPGIKINTTTSGPVTADVTASVISDNSSYGLNAVSGAGGGAIFNVGHSVIAGNGSAGIQADGSNAAAMVDTTLLDSNGTGATNAVAGGRILTYGTNRIVGSAGSGFTGSASLQ
jgi:hypothetical protein